MGHLMVDDAKILQIPVRFRHYPTMTAREMWASPEPSDQMIWEICVYTRKGDLESCHHCPASEPSDYGPVVRGCRALASEACRVVMACQRREAVTAQPNSRKVTR